VKWRMCRRPGGLGRRTGEQTSSEVSKALEKRMVRSGRSSYLTVQRVLKVGRKCSQFVKLPRILEGKSGR